MSSSNQNQEIIAIVLAPREQTEKIVALILAQAPTVNVLRVATSPISMSLFTAGDNSVLGTQTDSTFTEKGPKCQMASATVRPCRQPVFSNDPVKTGESLLDEKLLADRWDVSEKKLQSDRLSGRGCDFIKIGRLIRYRLSDVEAYEQANLRSSTSQGDAR
jgi:hypothetical protein